VNTSLQKLAEIAFSATKWKPSNYMGFQQLELLASVDLFHGCHPAHLGLVSIWVSIERTGVHLGGYRQTLSVLINFPHYQL
jgi:hypothetical protein